MFNKMLLGGVLVLLAGCGGNKVSQPKAVANDPGPEVSRMSNFDPEDSQQQGQDKAEARGAAQAKADLQGDVIAEKRRKDEGGRKADQ
jgi:hypothetical protein